MPMYICERKGGVYEVSQTADQVQIPAEFSPGRESEQAQFPSNRVPYGNAVLVDHYNW